MSRLKRSNFFVFTQPSPPSQQIEKDQNSFLFSEKIQTPVVNGLFNSTTSPKIEDDMNSVDDIISDEKEYTEDNEEQGSVDNTEFEFDFYCSLNGEDASDLSVYDCDTIEDFDPLKCDLIISIDEVINLPNELKSVSIKTDYVKMTIDKSIEITTLNLQAQSELFIDGEGYLTIKDVKADNDASIETSVSLDIMNSDSISLFVNSQSVTRFYGNKLDSVEVNGILQIEKDISINELVMSTDGFISFKSTYSINVLKIISTMFVFSTQAEGTIENINLDELELLGDNVDICLIKSAQHIFPTIKNKPHFQSFSLVNCCSNTELHFSKDNAKITCSQTQCSLGTKLQPENCFDVDTNSNELTPIVVTLEKGYDLSKIKGKNFQQLVVPQDLYVELDGTNIDANEVIILGDATLTGLFYDVTANSVTLNNAQIEYLNVGQSVTLNNVLLSDFVEISNSDVNINGPVTTQTAELIFAFVTFNFNEGGSIISENSKIIISDALIQGNIDNFIGWKITNSKFDIDGDINVNYVSDESNKCKQIIKFENTIVNIDYTVLDDYDANLVKDTANTGLYVCNSYDAQEIKSYEDCKISSKVSNIPDDAKCSCTPKYCNYIVSGGSYNIKDDIGGIEGTDFTITGEDVLLSSLKCYGTCELYGDIDVDKIERSIGQYFVHDSVSIRSVGEGKENLVITGNERSIVSLIAETFSGINLNMKAGSLLEIISNEINNGYIEIDETAAMVVFDSYVVFDNSVISLSNNLHNAIALHEQSLISFNKNSQIQIRGEVVDELFIVYGSNIGEMKIPKVYSVVKEIASPIEVTKKCDIWLVLNSNSSTLCPTSPFNMKGVPVVTIPLKWTAKKRVFMLLMFIIIASSSLLSLLYLIYSLVSSTRRHALRSV
ncbi:Auto-transporter adhesin head GIN domain-containing protein [Entamoeba marina]